MQLINREDMEQEDAIKQVADAKKLNNVGIKALRRKVNAIQDGPLVSTYEW